jgi:hypothetical protein
LTADRPAQLAGGGGSAETVCRASAAEHIGAVCWREDNFDANPPRPGPFQSDRITFLGRSGQRAVKTCFAKLNEAAR